MSCQYPKMIWLRFQKDDNRNDIWSRLVSNEIDTKIAVKKAGREGYISAKVTEEHDVTIYDGNLNEEEIVSAINTYFEDFTVPNDYKKNILKYLEAAKILIKNDSDMEDIMYQRDKNYGEEEKVQRCIDFVSKYL